MNTTGKKKQKLCKFWIFSREFLDVFASLQQGCEKEITYIEGLITRVLYIQLLVKTVSCLRA